MRKILVSVLLCLFCLQASTQTPEKISYQAVVRDNANALVADKVVGMRISILQGSVTGTPAYVETQDPRSNVNGLVTLEIGAGTVVSGSFTGLNWSSGPYFIQTEIDPSGGSNYSILGVSQLVSVPYAMYAKTSGSSIPGPAGPAGAIGAQGPIGPAGVAGAAGTNGSAGPQGAKGDTGATGIAGADGAAGPNGPQGIQGAKGDTGATGPDGPTGLIGPQGIQGERGFTGSKGDKGDTGAQGPAGANNGITYTVTNSGSGAYLINGGSNPPLTVIRGMTYIFQINAVGHPFWLQTTSGSYNASNIYSTAVTDNGKAVGTITWQVPFDAPNTVYYACQFHSSMNGQINVSDAGPVGPQGLKGDVGEQGIQGLTGVAGLDGATGPTGVGGVTTAGTNINLSGSGTVASPYVVSANIPAAAAGTLTGSSLNATVTGSNLTSVGTLTSAIINGKVIVGALSAASASAALEVSSTSQGFLPPRMTRDQRIGIVNPAAGLIIWCTNCGTAGELQVNNGTSWTNLIGGPASLAVPAPPTNPVATAGNAQASITFTPPASDGGSTITGFTVTSFPGSFTSTGTSSPLLVTGLINGTSYTFTVVATNAVGNSVASSVSGAVLPLTIPGAPTNPVAIAGDEQASIAFIGPAFNGGSAITGFTVTSSPGGFTSTGTSSPLVVTGLTNLKSYTFTVVAINAVGNSISSVASAGVIPGTVIGAGGRIWMDRNLGATRVATSITDAEAYGDLYQWGRSKDGHQLRTSATTTTKSRFLIPTEKDPSGNGKFITGSTNWYIGDVPDGLWNESQGFLIHLNFQLNNPCPIGYVIPTGTEWDTERKSWIGGNNAAGAFASPLKLVMAGGRMDSGPIFNNTVSGYYWGSTVKNNNRSGLLLFNRGDAYMYDYNRAIGFSVRCIKY